MAAFVDGLNNITEAQQKVALQAFEDGSIEDACPPLRALFSIMAYGTWEGKDAHDADVRRMFSLQSLLDSDWYQQRLFAKQKGDERLWQRFAESMDQWLATAASAGEATQQEMRRRRAFVSGQLQRVSSTSHLDDLRGTLGTDPSLMAFDDVAAPQASTTLCQP